MRFIFLFLLILLIIPVIYAQEVIGPSKEGISVEANKNQAINLGVVESSSIRIGNSRDDSIEKYKVTVSDVKDDFATLKYKKTENITIPLGEERKVDFDGDDIFDVSILLFTLRPNRATLVFKSLEDNVPELVSTTPETPIVSDNSTNNIDNSIPIKEENSSEKTDEYELTLGSAKETLKNNYVIWIIAAVLCILIILIILYFVLKK